MGLMYCGMTMAPISLMVMMLGKMSLATISLTIITLSLTIITLSLTIITLCTSMVGLLGMMTLLSSLLALDMPLFPQIDMIGVERMVRNMEKEKGKMVDRVIIVSD